MSAGRLFDPEPAVEHGTLGPLSDDEKGLVFLVQRLGRVKLRRQQLQHRFDAARTDESIKEIGVEIVDADSKVEACETAVFRQVRAMTDPPKVDPYAK